ncbi:porin [Cupriavidus sp. TA19]|uniref:porin n=1 Tax=unclassified Cupriavidus TaxID=2640874 RepID=UPI000E2F3CAD|nr:MULTISPECIES: porin [unclassified Cupriavidus]BDB27504.1 porin [Cupriavidus sp. P-10]GLC97394.1 porin [Cupriavidus sp. TA19]
MRKTIFALAAMGALGGFGATARANSSVTLYGVVDGSIEYVNRVATAQPAVVNGQPVFATTGGKRVGMPTLGGLSPSRWGLRGVEDLGSGNSAIFVLESGFAWDTGAIQSSRLFGRQAFVGLQNQSYGKLMLGRQYTSFFEGMANFAPLRFATTYEPVAWQLGTNYREDNTVKYVGQFGPVQAVAHYSFGVGVPAIGATALANGGAGETPGAFRDNNGYGASLTWLSNGFGATLAYDEWHPTVTSGQQGTSRKAGTAFSYATGPFKAMVGYRWAKVDFANGNTLARDDYYWAGVNYQATRALGLSLAYYYADFKRLSLGQTAPASNPANPWQVSFLVDYNLSKRTDVYLSAAYSRNAGLNFDSSQTLFLYGYPSMAGQKAMVGVTTGIRHVF